MGKATRMSFAIKNYRPHFENVQAVTNYLEKSTENGQVV